MQAQRVRVWFIALYMLLLASNICDSHQHQHKYNHNHNKARSKYTTQSFDDKPEGKIFGWKKQPQTNVIFITRPATLSSAPLASMTTTMFTSPVPTGPATVTALRRPYAQRYGSGGGNGGYRRVPVRRQSGRQGQVNRHQRPWNRIRVWAYGREGEEQNASPSDADADVDVETDNSGQQSLDEDDRDVSAEMGVGVKGGVSAKLDIEQLEKSLLSQQVTHIDNDAGQIAVVADDLNNVSKHRLKVKSKRPQTTAILATTMPATLLPPATATDDATSNEPTYAHVVVHSNGNMKKNKNSEGDKRQTIWQGIRQAWRERRERQKNAALKKQEDQEEEQEQLQPQVETEDEVAYVDSGNEIFIDENGEIHIRKRRKNTNRNRQQNIRQQQLNIKNKQKNKRRQPEEVTNRIKNNENSVISENNTNSRFQNIMNAFRRTPIIYKKQSR